MIERQTIIDAIQDLEESISTGDVFNEALSEIAESYKVPADTIIVNIQRVESIDVFITRCESIRRRQERNDEVFAPLRDYLQKIYGKPEESPTAFLATIMFIQKTFDRELWPSANTYARRLSKTLRLTKNHSRKSNAPNQ